MSIGNDKYVRCDFCNATIGHGSEHNNYGDAEDEAKEADWQVPASRTYLSNEKERKHLCPRCWARKENRDEAPTPDTEDRAQQT